MKNLIQNLLIAVALLAVPVIAVPPTPGGFTPTSAPAVSKSVNAFTTTDVIIINGSSTSNFPAALQLPFTIGTSGLGFGATIGGTNAATTTNATFTIAVSGNGVDYALNGLAYVSVPQTGTGYYPYFTNIPPTALNIATASSAVVLSCQNTNVTSIFITNAYFNTR